MRSVMRTKRYRMRLHVVAEINSNSPHSGYKVGHEFEFVLGCFSLSTRGMHANFLIECLAPYVIRPVWTALALTCKVQSLAYTYKNIPGEADALCMHSRLQCRHTRMPRHALCQPMGPLKFQWNTASVAACALAHTRGARDLVTYVPCSGCIRPTAWETFGASISDPLRASRIS